MRISFISSAPVADSAPLSNKEQYWYNCLRNRGHHVMPICAGSINRELVPDSASLLDESSIQCRPERDRRALETITGVIQETVKQQRPDIVFSVWSLWTAYLDARCPVISWSDAVFDCLVDFHPSYMNLTSENLKWRHEAEELSLQRCALSVLTSAWAANRAARRYRFPVERLRVVPVGANLPCVPARGDVLGGPRRGRDSLTAICIGSSWQFKGGDVALQAIRLLRERSHKANLITVGMHVPKEARASPWLRSFPYLSNDRPGEWSTFKALMLSADVLLLPTLADLTPHVISEAYAFGLPVIASAIGGIPEMIDHGVTGWLAQPDREPTEYAGFLETFISQPGRLAEMRAAARDRFDQELSYEVVSRKLICLFDYVLDARQSESRIWNPES
jgi:glycosyltransferase involved in cell wall biosynthesis